MNNNNVKSWRPGLDILAWLAVARIKFQVFKSVVRNYEGIPNFYL